MSVQEVGSQRLVGVITKCDRAEDQDQVSMLAPIMSIECETDTFE